MKQLFTIISLFCIMLCANAQRNGEKFDPQKFTRDQEAFITKHAQLTPQEAAAFFPLFHEMQEKQRNLFKSIRNKRNTPPTNEKAAEQMIENWDKIELQVKKLEVSYHAKFCRVIPATKVCRCIMAEKEFKNITMQKLADRRRQKK